MEFLDCDKMIFYDDKNINSTDNYLIILINMTSSADTASKVNRIIKKIKLIHSHNQRF